MAMIMLLCLCVMVQMLGVPATLLHSLETVDALAVSVSEGFSVPSSFPQLTPSVEMVLVRTRLYPSICRFLPLHCSILLLFANFGFLLHTRAAFFLHGRQVADFSQNGRQLASASEWGWVNMAQYDRPEPVRARRSMEDLRQRQR